METSVQMRDMLRAGLWTSVHELIGEEQRRKTKQTIRILTK